MPAVPLVVSPVHVIVMPGTPVTGNALSNVTAPAGAVVVVTAVKLPGGVSIAVPLVPSPLPLTDPTTGTVTGTLDIKPDGSFTFTPAPGWLGPEPVVELTVTSSDGQAKQVPLSFSINSILLDGNEAPIMPSGGAPLVVDVLANAAVPAGTTASVTGFTYPGSPTVFAAGPLEMPVVDPMSGKTAGLFKVLRNGTATYIPAAGFTGQVPAITYFVESSDGQTSPGVLAPVTPDGEAMHACHRGCLSTSS